MSLVNIVYARFDLVQSAEVAERTIVEIDDFSIAEDGVTLTVSCWMDDHSLAFFVFEPGERVHCRTIVPATEASAYRACD